MPVDADPSAGDLSHMWPGDAIEPDGFRLAPDHVAVSGATDDTVPTEALLRTSLEFALARNTGPLVLAVSGGRDSMALMHAVARWAPARLVAVATFDHGTGGYATDAAAHVAADARRLGLTVVRERARTAAHSEAEWREARWQFLRRVAGAFGARVATAHTRDDQAETVVMRLLRGAGTRGIAALAAPSRVVRPWLSVSRSEVAAWATTESIAFLEDPMNASRRYQRGRVRHELLPAFELAQPGLTASMIALGERAADWRRDLESYLAASELTSVRAGVLNVPVCVFDVTTDAGRAILWPACFARLGVVLDARGTRELVRFSASRRRGARVTVAGGAIAIREGHGATEWFQLRQPSHERFQPWGWTGEADRLPLRLGPWRLRRLPTEEARSVGDDKWVFGAPVGATVTVRGWRAGDRIRTAGAPAGRRVTRYFSDAHVSVLDRSDWPIVLAGDSLLCVPGLCRSVAAPHRPGWPDSIWYRCEREPC